MSVFFMMALKTIKNVLSVIVDFLTIVFGSTRGAIIALVLASVGCYFFITQRSEIKNLNNKMVSLAEQNEILVKNNGILKQNQIALEDANKQTYAALLALKAERKKAQAAIAEMARERKRTSQAMEELQAKIDEMRKDPNNNGPVAPVLRETIREIQNARDNQ